LCRRVGIDHVLKLGNFWIKQQSTNLFSKALHSWSFSVSIFWPFAVQTPTSKPLFVVTIVTEICD
jgi:hypothetical protein